MIFEIWVDPLACFQDHYGNTRLGKFLCNHRAAGTQSGPVADDQPAAPSEMRFEGVSVLLTGTDLDGNSVSMSATTDAGGIYTFNGIAEGNYSIQATARFQEEVNGPLRGGDPGRTEFQPRD